MGRRHHGQWLSVPSHNGPVNKFFFSSDTYTEAPMSSPALLSSGFSLSFLLIPSVKTMLRQVVHLTSSLHLGSLTHSSALLLPPLQFLLIITLLIPRYLPSPPTLLLVANFLHGFFNPGLPLSPKAFYLASLELFDNLV